MADQNLKSIYGSSQTELRKHGRGRDCNDLAFAYLDGDDDCDDCFAPAHVDSVRVDSVSADSSVRWTTVFGEYQFVGNDISAGPDNQFVTAATGQIPLFRGFLSYVQDPLRSFQGAPAIQERLARVPSITEYCGG